MKKKALNISRRSLALTLALVLVVGFVFMTPTLAVDTKALGQLIDSFTPNSSIFELTTSSRFFLAEQPTDEVTSTVQLAQQQFAADRLPSGDVLDIVWGRTTMVRDGDILIVMDPDNTTIGDEGYILDVTSVATVTAKDVRGLMYGLNMLQKHFRLADSTKINGFNAYDTPDTKERTVQLDCARKYLTVEYICNFVKEIAWMGYNSLQLHVSEDGGFRADFWNEAYYKDYNEDGVAYSPQNDFSWLCGSHVQTWVNDESSVGLKNYRVDPDAGKKLTTEQLVQILDTCKKYNIDVIPSFDSPAHMDYLNWKFEQYYLENPTYSFTYDNVTYEAAATNGCINYSGKTGAGSNGPSWPYYTTMDIRDDTTRGQMSQAFVKSIYTDMADFFKEYAGSTKFVIGADEVNLVNTNIYEAAWEYKLLPGYINEINTILEDKGYTCRIFNDFFTADAMDQLDPDIQILYWNTPFNSTNGKDSYYTVNYDAYINSSGKLAYTADPMVTVAEHIEDNRILFNCVNLHTYYVLRVAPVKSYIDLGYITNVSQSQGDARSDSNRQWEFYEADEVGIYNKWTPNNIRKDGDHQEGDRIVDDAHFGGAYFLTWHDYAAVNTETEMWNGVYDAVKQTGEFYSVRYRMWSNTIKMWNWDINNSLSFDDFKILREKMGDFPGLSTDTYSDPSYAKATTLPDATAPIAMADHTALTAELAVKIEQGDYSDRTYSVYEAAYNAAVEVNNKNNASATELGTALANLIAAREGLQLRTNSYYVDLKTNINGTEYTIKSTAYETPVTESTFSLFIPYMPGYDFVRVEGEGATFTPSASGDGSGYLNGPAISDVTYTIWFVSNVDTDRLQDLVEEAITEQGNFTHASWTIYSTALKNAQNFQLTLNTSQADVDKLVQALEEARNALVISSDVTTIAIEKVSGSFLKGHQVGLHIKTSADVASLTVTNTATGEVQTLDICTGEVQELNSGEVVKYWLLIFPVEDVGTFTYSVSYHGVSDDITITVTE